MAAQQDQANIMAQAQADQAKSDSKIQEETTKSDLELRNLQKKIEWELDASIALERATLELQMQYGSGKVQEAAQIEELKSANRKEENQIKDDNKKSLVDKQSTQQSKMVKQREVNGPPQNFESQSFVEDLGAPAVETAPPV